MFMTSETNFGLFKVVGGKGAQGHTILAFRHINLLQGPRDPCNELAGSQYIRAPHKGPENGCRAKIVKKYRKYF